MKGVVKCRIQKRITLSIQCVSFSSLEIKIMICGGKKMKRSILSFLMILALLATNVSVFAADDTLNLSTRFPIQYTDAGNSLTYDIKIDNSSGNSEVIHIGTETIPVDWDYILTVDNKQVNDVYIDQNETINARLKVDIPLSAENNSYKFKFYVDSPSQGTTYLPLTAEVKEVTYKENELTVDYPDLSGDTKTSFSYRLNIANNGLEDVSYSLDSQLPTGWQASFIPSGSADKVASILVEAGSNKDVTMKLTIPEFTAEGNYPITFNAKSNSEVLTKDLSVKITGLYELKLTTPTGKLSDQLVAGQEKQIKLQLENTGGSEIKNIELSSWEPKGWETRFDEKVIDSLLPGQTKEVIAYVKADEKAISGDYAMSVSCKTPEINEKLDFRMTVLTSKLWGAVGLGIIAAFVLGIYGVIKKYGRR